MAIELPALYVDTVAATVETRRPVLINRDPAPGDTRVPLDNTIVLELTDVGDDGVGRAATRIWVQGVLALDGLASPEIQPGFDGPRARVTEEPRSLRIALDPQVPLTSQEVVVVRVRSQTRGGAHAMDEDYAFQAEDRTAPRALAAQATAPRAVRVGFDEPVTVVDLDAIRIESLDSPAVPLAAIDTATAGSVLLLSLNTEMTPDVRYRITAEGIADTRGNAAVAPHNSVVFTGFRPQRPAARRFDLWSMIPRHNRREDDTQDLRHFIACVQELVDLLLAEIDRFPTLFDLERAPPPFLDLILSDLGNPFAFDLNDVSKRRLAATLVRMYQQKGTAVGIQNAIRFFLGLEVAIAAFAAETLVLGESELGVDWLLGPSARFARYAFNIVVDEPLTDMQQHRIRSLVDYMKPAHTHFVDLLGPALVSEINHWELGLSELGETTLLHG